MRGKLRWGTAAFALFLQPSASMPALAQDATSPSPPAPVCMARQSSAPGAGELVIVIPADKQTAMEARGFASHACSDDPGALAAYRAKICQLANNAPQALLDQFNQANSVSPAELCEMAKALSS